METKKISVEKLSATAGILLCLGYIAYFMLMKLLNLVYITELRVLNFFIQMLGIFLTLRYFKSSRYDRFQYLEGFGLGFITSTISVVLFSLFIYFYFISHPSLLLDLQIDAPILGNNITPFLAAFSVMIEGEIASLILSFAIMQYYKDDAANQPFRKTSRIQSNPEE